jgi:deoxyribose-phosphate aldolase
MAAIVMCECIKAYYKKTGRKVGFKAAGGIKTPSDAITYLAITQSILGNEWATPQLFRLGASGLANNLLSILKGETVSYF